MIIQGLNTIASLYGSVFKSSVERQSLPTPVANYADRVSISDAAKALLSSSTQDAEVQQRIAAIKAKPGVERTAADFEYLSANDKHFAELQDKIKANGNNGFDTLTADEVDYMQKAGGFVNTMAELSPKEKALYDELVASGNFEAAHGLALVGMSRVGMGGQQVTLPNGKIFDPANTEVTAANIQYLFKQMFVDPSGNTDKQFDALASYLDKREAANKVTSKV
jgi:hypothetical protein